MATKGKARKTAAKAGKRSRKTAKPARSAKSAKATGRKVPAVKMKRAEPARAKSEAGNEMNMLRAWSPTRYSTYS